MIVTDDIGLIGQHSKEDPSYLDFGDSCMKTSMAVIGGIADPALLQHFITKDNLVIRHPNDINTPRWSDPKATSRDQLICLMAALNYSGELHKFPTYKWRINKDIMFAPDVFWFAKVASGDNTWSWVGEKALYGSIVFASRVKPDHELNQLAVMCITLGGQYVRRLCACYPSWKNNFIDYWHGWRDQPEIGDALIKVIEARL